jgi:hypothetical protein
MLRIVAVVAGVALLFGASFGRNASAQSDFTLAGEWILSFSPINGQLQSKFGNTLGFADRDITFNQDGSLLTAIVDREDLGPSVKPLGDWRVAADSFSATFELWCPDPGSVCGTVTLRGSFVNNTKINGTATAFFEQEDPSTPTGLDTWTMQFTGRQIAGAVAGD